MFSEKNNYLSDFLLSIDLFWKLVLRVIRIVQMEAILSWNWKFRQRIRWMITFYIIFLQVVLCLFPLVYCRKVLKGSKSTLIFSNKPLWTYPSCNDIYWVML